MWTPSEDSEGRQTRVNPDTGVFEKYTPSSGGSTSGGCAEIALGAFTLLFVLGVVIPVGGALFDWLTPSPHVDPRSVPAERLDTSTGEVYYGPDRSKYGPAPSTETVPPKPTNTYPDDVRRGFVSSCLDTSAASVAYCECVWNGLTAEFTYEQFAALEREGSNGILANRARDFATSCAGHLD